MSTFNQDLTLCPLRPPKITERNMMNFKFSRDLSHFLSESFPGKNSNDIINITPELCPPNMNGEITINCFRLAKELRQKPDTIAEKTEVFLLKHPDIEGVERIKAFVNVTLKVKALYAETIADINLLLKNAVLDNSQKEKTLIEYSAPNTNKPLHLGHLRNNALGMALTSLLRRVGNDVIAVNLINDRGIHICKSMLAYKLFGNDITPEMADKKGDHLVGDFYIKFDAELRKQLKEVREKNPELAGKTDDELFAKTEIGLAAQDILKKWENNDPETINLWKTMNSWVLTGFNETYKRMGVKFDKVYLESDTYKLGRDVVLDELKKGVFKRREDGAVYIDLEKYKLNRKVLLRADNTSVYITQDIGTTILKYNDFHPARQIWIVGDEQIHHFKTLFAIIKALGYEWSDDLYHLAYGMVNLPSGKMKSREGTVVDADNLFDEMVDLAKQATLERCGENIPEEINKRAEIIGLGALKFMLLKFNPKTTIMFDPQASIKFEGDTGPYVQYVCARINSILKKAKEQYGDDCINAKVNWELLNSKWEKHLAILSAFYKNALITSAKKLDCSGLIAYLINLAKAYNSFYRECSVLNAETEELRNARLALSAAVKTILKDGLNTLTIDIPDAM